MLIGFKKLLFIKLIFNLLRSKFDPLWNTYIVGGLEDGEPFLGYVNLQGTAFTETLVCTGLGKYRVPHIVFRFLMSLLIGGRAIMCMKSGLPASSIGKQWEAKRLFFVDPVIENLDLFPDIRLYKVVALGWYIIPNGIHIDKKKVHHQ